MPECTLCGAIRELGEHCANGHPEVEIHTQTYVYTDYRNNLIVDPDNVAIRRKAERDPRIAHENSEDALTWNVFRGLQYLKALDGASTQLFGTTGPVEAYFWTLSAKGETWQPLLQIFGVLEAHISPQGQRSEPDLVLVNEKGRRVVFVEAKFGASVRERTPPDWFLARDGVHTPEYRDRILANYQKGDPDRTLFASELPLAQVISEGFYQLMRHALFANYITRNGGRRGWQWTLCNLISPSANPDQPAQCRAFQMLLAPRWREQYRFLIWRDVYEAVPIAARRSTADGGLQQSLADYLGNKTYNGEAANLIAG